MRPPHTAASANQSSAPHGSTPARSSSAAPDGRNVDGVSDLPLGREATVPSDLWGLLWIAKAGEAGLTAAAAEPLPGDDETVARQIARRFAASPRQRVFVQRHAEVKAGQAVAAFRAAQVIAREVLRESPVPKRLSRTLAAATIDADRLGCAAAKCHRVLALLSGEQGGVQ